MFPIIGTEIEHSKKESLKVIEFNDNKIFLIIGPKGFTQLVSSDSLSFGREVFNQFIKNIKEIINIKRNISFYPSAGIEIEFGTHEFKLRQRYSLSKSDFNKLDDSEINEIIEKNNLKLYLDLEIPDFLIPDWLATRFWEDKESFKINASPVLIAKNNQLISICYSAANFNNYSEVDILTNEEFRKKGLASICASKYIQNIFNKGINPLWDVFVENPGSYKLAEKFGYKKVANPYVFYRSFEM